MAGTSIWIGDSLLARPRHEPLTLLAAVAARVPRVELGTAVLLPTLRNPVLLAHQVATLDRIAEGRLILGVGIARDVPDIRAEFTAAGVPFEKRVGRMLEGLRLCRELWSGKPVDWEGRWKVENGVLGPTPHRPGGPPLWIAGSLPASLERAGKHFDGWLPNDADAAAWGGSGPRCRRTPAPPGAIPQALTGAMYLTLAVDEDAARANRASMPTRPVLPSAGRRHALAPGLLRRSPGGRRRVACGLRSRPGASHLVLRFAGDHERPSRHARPAFAPSSAGRVAAKVATLIFSCAALRFGVTSRRATINMHRIGGDGWRSSKRARSPGVTGAGQRHRRGGAIALARGRGRR